MQGDFSSVFVWWVAFLALGAIFSPLAWLLFRKFSDTGWGLSKILGLALTTFTFFVFSSLKILPITQSAIFLVILVFLLINFYVFLKNKKQMSLELSSKKYRILISEILFLLGLIAWSFVRAHQPDIRGLEKFMDYGFINSILRDKYLPPADMWYAGNTINYYWFGHLATGLLTKLTNLPSAVTYNLMLGTTLGFGLSAAFSIVSSLFDRYGKKAAIAGT